jgi:hypothetical protein
LICRPWRSMVLRSSSPSPCSSRWASTSSTARAPNQRAARGGGGEVAARKGAEQNSTKRGVQCRTVLFGPRFGDRPSTRASGARSLSVGYRTLCPGTQSRVSSTGNDGLCAHCRSNEYLGTSAARRVGLAPPWRAGGVRGAEGGRGMGGGGRGGGGLKRKRRPKAAALRIPRMPAGDSSRCRASVPCHAGPGVSRTLILWVSS